MNKSKAMGNENIQTKHSIVSYAGKDIFTGLMPTNIAYDGCMASEYGKRFQSSLCFGVSINVPDKISVRPCVSQTA